ncbi:MAG: hypothetical protein MI717_00580 [Spirochaetales bacterium]|nr:hypothetical protein [Spirochaetales bacterium]
MIILLVAADSNRSIPLQELVRPARVIAYNHPLKALDNLDEVNPDILICDAADYPRHWKLLVQHLKERNPQSHVLLTVPSSFSEQESEKATFLGVKALCAPWWDEAGLTEIHAILEPLLEEEKMAPLSEGIQNLTTPNESEGLILHVEETEEIPLGKGDFSDDSPLEETRPPQFSIPGKMIFQHPVQKNMMACNLTEVSCQGALVQSGGQWEEMAPGDCVQGASLKVGHQIVDVDFLVVELEPSPLLSFTNFQGTGFHLLRDALTQYLEGDDETPPITA